MNLNSHEEQSALNTRIRELEEKLNSFDRQYVSNCINRHRFSSLCSRCKAQNDEIARLQLENNILQEKITNEKRKVSILEVKYSHYSF